MSTVLDKIVASKRREIAESKARVPESELRRRLAEAPAVRDFAGPLAAAGDVKLIAEVKRASPSAGLIRPDFDPVAIATTYAAHGASAISVLTDAPFFQGSLADMTAVRRAVALPVLRKDFVVDRYQITEARVHGADAVLLIAELLPGEELTDRLAEIHELGMEALVELYDAANLPRVLASGARVIGVNNRDLRTFVTDLAHTLDLAAQVPRDRILVSESGIRTRADVLRLQAAGARAILVGETLMRAADVGSIVRQLVGTATP
jgi:indole-3-glycerol phosphate synthase